MKFSNSEKLDLENLLKGKMKTKDKLLSNLLELINEDKNIAKKLLSLIS